MAAQNESRESRDLDRKLEGGEAEPASPPSKPEPPLKNDIHPAFYIALWISLSASVILFNKWVLHTAKFEFRKSLQKQNAACALPCASRVHSQILQLCSSAIAFSMQKPFYRQQLGSRLADSI
ncbi:hypothetical protein AC578_1879 [Pseudocercospora eumusae]|uniref:Uncharacterized protein n=1 Tax=Pseudocercospora eumusae TaxID=321146 RepID=A0A139H3J6_9PEZI|nr:hypothetical protein AC578_1879 [Pseudocercospora eumusae]